MKWHIERIKEIDLSIIRLSGEVSREAFASLLEELFSGGWSRNELLDLSKASLFKIKESDIIFWIRKTQEVEKGVLSDRAENERRSAFFAPQDVNFGVARMWQTLLELHRSPIVLEVFRTENEALKWLLSSVYIS